MILFPAFALALALAHGDNPASCANRYDSDVVGFMIEVDGQRFDPFHEQVAFDAKVGVGYTVELTLATPPLNAAGAAVGGTTWYRTTAFGFGLGQCVPDIQGATERTIRLEGVRMSQAHDGFDQSVVWEGYSGRGVSYIVRWHD